MGVASSHEVYVYPLMREFVSAGGELIIHVAPHIKNSPTRQVVKCRVDYINAAFEACLRKFEKM